ncbi:histidine triad (HIT) family protein [Flavobacterium sp. 1]|uniref:HIT family protein n=1 Tax=Flavobacterium sp. 1 TaxID=2035200 RepID=UPI000C23A608|nr:HIT family protein [Flavobacterium sp. 1]PJJ07863.1 histidine triad (HIT) family protein [Flavobacterium sp. 1]
MNTCRFCQIISSQRENEEIIFESNEFIVITDQYRRTSAGAICLIIPKKHKQNILELEESNGNELIKTLKLIGMSMQKAYSCNGIRIWTAVNKEAGQSIFHCHIHLLACKSLKDRIIASFPGVYDLKRRIFNFRNRKLNRKLNFELAEKIRTVIKVKGN